MVEERRQKARKLLTDMIARDHSKGKGKAVVQKSQGNAVVEEGQRHAVVEEGQGNAVVEEGQIRFQFVHKRDKETDNSDRV